MIVYVMRHAEAVEASDTLADEWRYLTEKGRQAAHKASSKLASLSPKPRLTLTSPLTRAVQTAEIAALHACRKNSVVATPLLLPDAEVAELAEKVKECATHKRLLLVGHEPLLGQLIATLLEREELAITLKKGAYVALELDPGKTGKPAHFLYYATPGKGRITSLKKAFPL